MGNSEFKPSPYQEAIFRYIREENGNLVVKAVAGSGKSTTIIRSLDFIPENRTILFAAFNVDIVRELNERIGNRKNITVRTLHSLGYAITRRFLGRKPEVSERKYEDRLDSLIPDLSVERKSNILGIADLARFSLSDCERKLKPLVKKYGYMPYPEDMKTALELTEWGKAETDVMDYTDMVWLPNVLPMQFHGFFYDFVFIDECQDMNAAQRGLAMKCMKNGSRFVAVGDDEQCIYAFMGSDPDSFAKLSKTPNTETLPLSVTYRCPKRAVEYVHSISQSIQCPETAIEGDVRDNVSIYSANPGDMVLCRNNAPLVEAFIRLSKAGKNTMILGKDFAKVLYAMVDSIDFSENSYGLSDIRYAETMLYERLLDERNRIAEKFALEKQQANCSQYIRGMYDRTRASISLLKHFGSVGRYKEEIDKMYENEKCGDCITLSTVHKSKGLEAKNVFILCPSLMPSAMAETKLDIEQERNIMYVAYTRCKESLNFISDKFFEPYEQPFRSKIALHNDFEMMELAVSKVKSAASGIPAGNGACDLF